MEKLFTKAEVETSEKGGLQAVASSSVEDRHGEMVSVEGWDLKNFKKNPVLQWAHDHSIPAIGIAKNIHIDGEGKKAKLIFEPVFHEVTEFAKAIKTLFEDKVLNSFSVGFRPLEMDGSTYTSQELLEISAVNVPANPEARMLAYKSLHEAGFEDGLIKQMGIEKQENTTASTEPDLNIILVEADKSAQRLDRLEQEMKLVVKGLTHLNPHNGRSREIATKRLSMLKVIARASDKLLSEGNTAPDLKVVKRAAEMLIVDHKQELKQHGKNQRTPIQSSQE